MSILEKLKVLVANLEEGKSEEQVEKDLNDIIEESQPEIEAVEETPDYLECDEEESSEVHSLLVSIRLDKEKMSDALMEFERDKVILLRRISKNTEEFYAKLNSLRLEYGVPEEGYVVQLPSSPEEKVSFKKE
jgi:hypothetical protein|tara:strand:+ start:539 stop:937 length:399 start_codon:yes stop_codon:yes gene_type:complete